MRQSVMLLALLLAPILATAEQFDLVCTYSVATAPQQPPQETIQHIDTDRNTVNGFPAKISEGEIKYEGTLKEDQSRTMTFVINRYTGTLQSSFSGPPDPKYPSARGTCTKAKQKF